MFLKKCHFKSITILIIVYCSASIVMAQGLVMTNVYSRPSVSLNGQWQYIVDPYENGYYTYRYEPFDQQEQPWASAFFLNSKPKNKSDLLEYDFDGMDSLAVPGDWNTQKENLFYYEGTVWYKRSFDYTNKKSDDRVYLYFGAVNYKAEVYLNGHKLGTHIGGFTPFQYEVTDQLKEEDNFLIVKVDNKRVKTGVPTLNTDWWNYGGITRDVKLIPVASSFIANYSLTLDNKDNRLIHAKISLDGDDKSRKPVMLQIPELDINTTVTTGASGYAEANIRVADLDYWSPDNPRLYSVTLKSDVDSIADEIGFRSISTSGSDILLNGEPVFLRGISIHEESPYTGGRAHTIADAVRLLQWAKDLGGNYVRLAHYPHNEHMVRMADKMGLLVWSEIPVYWTIDWTNPDTYANAEQQLSAMLSRDHNRAAVIIWSMANETPTSIDRTRFLTSLATYARDHDGSRLISAALEQHDYKDDPSTRTIDDPFAEVVDVLSFNQYIGWYDGAVEKCRRINWQITQDKPVIISEFGAGAKYGLHGDKSERWTEEYQAYLYEETVAMLSKIDKLSGMSPWLLVDFRSPRRVLPVIQDNYNRKGLISEKGERKMAFDVLRRYYKTKE